jgi:predicted phage tail protein
MSGRDGFRIRELPEDKRIARKGGKGGGGAAPPYKPVDYPNTMRSLSTAQIMEVLSEGVIRGPYYQRPGAPWYAYWQSVFLDGTPVADAAGNFNFNIVANDFRFGAPTQDPVAGFAMAEAEIAVGLEATDDHTPIVRRLSSSNISAVRITVRIPALYMTEDDGDVNATATGYEADYSIDGGSWTYGWSDEIFGKTISPYERAVRIQLPQASSTIDIRVIRTQVPARAGEANSIFWSSYTEIQDGMLSYDDTALIALSVDAEQFPSIPSRAYLLDGIQVLLPTNYDPYSHGYSGDWDGTWKTDWTNNPAWILYALLTNERWGLGRFLDVNLVDKWSFYEAAYSNDAEITNGAGGYEPRWRCNCVINTRQDAWQVLQAVASSMLGSLYFANGTVFLVQDRLTPADTRLFGPADVVNGIFDYTGTDYRSKFTAAAVTWIDPDDQYQPAVELVLDGTLVAQQGYKETQATAFGCTYRSQAIRYGRWLIYTSQFETEVVTFSVGLENADIRPGETISISDPSRVGARLAGRLLDDQGSDTVTLDRAPPIVIDTIGGWTLYFQVGSAAEAQKPTIVAALVTEVLPNNQLRLNNKPAGLDAGTMWLLSQSTAVVPTSWRVASVTDKGSGVYEVLATEYHREKYTYVDSGWLLPTPPFSLIPTGPIQPPSDINFAEVIYLDASGWPQFEVIISWTPAPDPRVSRYQLEMSGPNGDYRRFEVVGVAQEVPNMRQGQWQIVLRAFDNLGRKSQAVNFTFTPIGLSAKPLPPSALYITPQGGNLTTLAWTPTGEIDVVFYWVKWTRALTGATWARATTSIARVDRNTTQISTPTRSGTFMVKSIDSLGQESDDWAEAILEAQQTESSIFFDEAQQPTWAGTLGLWHRNIGELWLPPPPAPETVPPDVFPGERGLALNQTPTRVGVYGFDAGFDLGASTLVTMTGYVEGYGTTLGLTMSRWTPLASAVPLASGTHNSMSNWIPLAMANPLATGDSQQWDAHIEARVSPDGTSYGDWFPLKSTVITGQAFQWRMVGTLYDLLTTLRAVQAGVIIEVPLRSVQGNDVALDGTGHLVVTYVAPFLQTPTVQITARQTVSPGGNIVITESDRDHFKVEHRNAAGVATANSSIDYFVQGFGGHS